MSWFWKSHSRPGADVNARRGLPAAGRRARFGPIELDTLTEELWKEGARVRLQSQPFRILVLLISNPGELVTRDAIRAAIWPEESAPGFDNSINASMNKLRAAIEDSAQTPRYVETLARRGYRFIGAVEWMDRPGTGDSAGPRALVRRIRKAAIERKWQVILTTLALGLLAALLVAEVRFLT